MAKKTKKWVWYVVFFAVIFAIGLVLFKSGFQGMTSAAIWEIP